MAKVLIIDDDPAVRDLYTQQFQVEGLETCVAVDGQAALESLSLHKPDLILLGMLMPGMDGMQFLRELRNFPEAQATPVIILTNLEANDEVLEGIIEYKPAYYMLKINTTSKEIVQKVKDILGVTTK